MKSIYLTSLGCAKNLVDSERFLASAMGGLGLEAASEIEQADLVLINTCGFLQSAVEEALDVIMEAGARRKKGAALVVAGCLPARYRGAEGQDLAAGLPEVDLWLRPEDYHLFESEIAGLIKSEKMGSKPPAFENDCLPAGPRLAGGGQVTATPFFRSYLKIAEGCDNHCTYCLIPRLRGPLRSYEADRLVDEARQLAAAGVQELTLVAQDLTAYGRDAGESGALVKLARRLADIKGLAWLRLLYAYPERLDEATVKDLAAIDKVTPYLDLPFQHAAPDILKKMGRKLNSRPLAIVNNLRRWWPGLALRTTLIVGFPGESEAHFSELTEFVEEAAFDHLGVFEFSPEPEAPASRLADQLPAAVKENRHWKIMDVQGRISLARNRARVGQTVPVLVEGPADDSPIIDDSPVVMVGRGPFQAPEVDGLIYFDGEQPEPGRFVETVLTKASAYDLAGRIKNLEG